ncbi:hypothetical protein Tco_0596498 [Tanacetum coccineum]
MWTLLSQLCRAFLSSSSAETFVMNGPISCVFLEACYPRETLNVKAYAFASYALSGSGIHLGDGYGPFWIGHCIARAPASSCVSAFYHWLRRELDVVWKQIASDPLVSLNYWSSSFGRWFGADPDSGWKLISLLFLILDRLARQHRGDYRTRMTLLVYHEERSPIMSFSFMNLWVGCCNELHHPCAQDLVPAEDTCNFPEFLIQSGLLAWLWVFDVMYDSWNSFLLMLSFRMRRGNVGYEPTGSSVTTAFTFPTILASLGVAFEPGSLISYSSKLVADLWQTSSRSGIIPFVMNSFLSLFLSSSTSLKVGFPFLTFCGSLRLEGFFVGGGAVLDCLTGVVVVVFLGVVRFVAGCTLALSQGVFLCNEQQNQDGTMDVLFTCQDRLLLLVYRPIRDEERSCFSSLVFFQTGFVACFSPQHLQNWVAGFVLPGTSFMSGLDIPASLTILGTVSPVRGVTLNIGVLEFDTEVDSNRNICICSQRLEEVVFFRSPQLSERWILLDLLCIEQEVAFPDC